MAKKQSDSKIAVAGALAVVFGLAGVMLVKEPLRSSRPVSGGLEMNSTTGEQLVRARLWEDPVAAVQRGLKDARSRSSTSSTKWNPTNKARSYRSISSRSSNPRCMAWWPCFSICT